MVVLEVPRSYHASNVCQGYVGITERARNAKSAAGRFSDPLSAVPISSVADGTHGVSNSFRDQHGPSPLYTIGHVSTWQHA